MTAACEACGAAFERATGPGRPRRFCLDCRPREGDLRPMVEMACPWCGEAFTARHAGRVYCSARCRHKARDESKKIPCAGCATPIFHNPRTSRPVGEARCRSCSRAPCGTHRAYKNGCRCIDCRRANTEATRKYLPPAYRHHWISPTERLAIYDRDDWTCQLCFDPVDVEVHHLHRDAPTLDHIEPQSVALIPDHSPANLRTAHRGCNASRGNRVSA